ncbi:hypothetical protein LOB98_09260, partial [Lactobacillus delbrueckii subsp. lactis]|nr:hypothetical protein [Lactobacillus delbrueckii subsp. lactis]
SPSKVHARGIIAITSSLIEYLLAKLLSFQGFIVIFGVGSLSYNSLFFEITEGGCIYRALNQIFDLILQESFPDRALISK